MAKKKNSGPSCITLENMLPKSSRQRISGGHTKLSFSHISFRIKGKPENTCGTNMCDKRFQEKRPPQLQKAHCLKMTQKSLIFYNIASEASYGYSLINEIQLSVYIFKIMSAVCLHFKKVSCLFTFFSQWQLFVYIFENHVSYLFIFTKKVGWLFMFFSQCQLFVYILAVY